MFSAVFGGDIFRKSFHQTCVLRKLVQYHTLDTLNDLVTNTLGL